MIAKLTIFSSPTIPTYLQANSYFLMDWKTFKPVVLDAHKFTINDYLFVWDWVELGFWG